MRKMNIPMSSPDITDAERIAVSRVMKSRFLSMGDELLEFEKSFKEYTGADHVIGVNSGTAGLHLCVRAAGIWEGDLVITTPYSFVASTNVLLYEKAVPVFVDVDIKTGNIDTEQIKQSVSDIYNKTANWKKWLPRRGGSENGELKAILVVDVFGQPADFDPINEIAKDYRLTIIEDSCEALGAEYKNQKAGTLGEFGVFAFYPNKQITTGEGAVIITNDEQKADYMRSLRNQGRVQGDRWLNHSLLGYNYRLDEMSAALGNAQLLRIEEILRKREMVANWYLDRIKEISCISPYQLAPETTRMSWFVFVILINQDLNRDMISARLSEFGVPSRPYFIPIHLQPYMMERFGYQVGDFPVTEELGKRSLALPFSSIMSEEQVDYVCQALRAIIPE